MQISKNLSQHVSLYKEKIEEKTITLNSLDLKYFVINYIWVPLLIFNIVLITINTFYRGWNYLELWSFKLDDPTWLPGKLQNIPLYFGHYFGDYTLSVGYVKLEDIYNPTELIPFGGPPTSIPILKLFSIFPDKIGILLFVLINILLILTLILLAKGSKGVISLFILLTSMPLFVTLDRGNFIGISVFCMGLALILLDSDKKIIKPIIVLLLIVAISIKIYTIIFLLFLLLIKRYRVVIYTLLTFTFFNILWIAFTRYTLVDVLDSARISANFQYIQYGINSLQGGIGPIATFYNLLVKFQGQSFADTQMTEFNFIKFIFPLFYILLMTGVLVSNKFKIIEKKSLIMSGFMFLPPIAYNYTLTWAIPALLMLISGNLHKKIKEIDKISLILIICCILTLVPWGFGSYRYIYSFMWAVLLFVLNFYSISKYVTEKPKK